MSIRIGFALGPSFSEIVATDDQGEFMIRPAVAHEPKAICRVIRLGQIDLESTGDQSILALYGEAHHDQPVEVGTQRTVLFEWVLRRDHQPHLIQMPSFEHVFRNGHVALVRGIEGSE